MKGKNSKSIPDIIFDSANALFMAAICLSMIYPFIYVISLSFGGGNAIATAFNFTGREITLKGYDIIFSSIYIMRGFLNTFVRVGLGTTLSLIATMLAAYPLSKKYFPHRKFWTLFIVFTMFFSGGLIPIYIVVRNLGLMDKVWSLVLPVLIQTFHMFIMRNYFLSIPDSLEESARIDGANDIVILIRIIIPVSMPIIATIILWTVVAHWNEWFYALIYINSTRKQVMQVILRGIVIAGTFQDLQMPTETEMALLPPESVKAAAIIVATIPMLVFYPFVQKYFVKGIMVGSLKG